MMRPWDYGTLAPGLGLFELKEAMTFGGIWLTAAIPRASPTGCLQETNPKPSLKKKKNTATFFRMDGVDNSLTRKNVSQSNIQSHESAKKLCQGFDRGGRGEVTPSIILINMFDAISSSLL